MRNLTQTNTVIITKSSYNKFYDTSINDILLDIPDASPPTDKSKRFSVGSLFEM